MYVHFITHYSTNFIFYHYISIFILFGILSAILIYCTYTQEFFILFIYIFLAWRQVVSKVTPTYYMFTFEQIICYNYKLLYVLYI